MFYLWDFGVSQQEDHGFKKPVEWDIPLLEGYEYEFVPNTSRNPGTHHFWGLQKSNIAQTDFVHFAPDAVLIYGYKYSSLLRLILGGVGASPPRRVAATGQDAFRLSFVGDSHRLTSGTGIWAMDSPGFDRAVCTGDFRPSCRSGGANRDYFRYHGVPEGKLFTAPHAVDNERFFRSAEAAAAEAVEWRRELGIPAGRQVVLFVGKFERKKRPDDLISAFLKAAPGGASLLLVGDGELAPMLREMAAGKAEIYFAPFQNQTQMPRTYAAGDVSFSPARAGRELGPGGQRGHVHGAAGDREFSCGVRSGNLVHPYDTGLVFSAGDVDDLAKKLQIALSDRARLQKWGSSAREQMDRYSYRQATAGLMKALESILKVDGALRRSMPTSIHFRWTERSAAPCQRTHTFRWMERSAAPCQRAHTFRWMERSAAPCQRTHTFRWMAALRRHANAHTLLGGWSAPPRHANAHTLLGGWSAPPRHDNAH